VLDDHCHDCDSLFPIDIQSYDRLFAFVVLHVKDVNISLDDQHLYHGTELPIYMVSSVHHDHHVLVELWTGVVHVGLPLLIEHFIHK